MEVLDDRITPTILEFYPAAPFTVGAEPAGVAVADFDGDGRPDIVTANAGDDSVSILQMKSYERLAPVFAPPLTLAVGGTRPVAVVVADFDNDGRPDIATANAGSDTVTVLVNTTALGSSAPTFATQPFQFAVGARPTAVRVGDFNGDGYADLATTNGDDGTVSVRMNVSPLIGPAVGFGPVVTLAVGPNPVGLVIGDFDGDTRPDIVTANAGDGSLTLFFNRSAVRPVTGGYAPAFQKQPVAVSVTAPAALAAGDFNGDGVLDLVVTSGSSGTASILLNTTHIGQVPQATVPPSTVGPFGSFAATFAVGASPSAVAVGDFDSDGRDDIAVTNSAGGTVSVLLNTATSGTDAPAFTPAKAFATGAGPAAIAVADLSGDGRHDFVTADAGAGTASVATVAADTPKVSTPSLVGQFAGGGVYQFDLLGNTWTQLTGAEANALAVAPNGNVVASFGGNGVWYYRPTGGWSRIHAATATALAIDGLGNVYASLNGIGTARFTLSGYSLPGSGTPPAALAAGGWHTLTGVPANLLVTNAAGKMAASFAGYGTYTFDARGWASINGYAATALAIGGNGDVAASYAGFGTSVYSLFTSWSRLDATVATALAFRGNGSVAGNVHGSALRIYDRNRLVSRFNFSGRVIAPQLQVTTLAADLFGNIYAGVAGAGVYEYLPATGWRQLMGATASVLSVG